MASDTQNRDSQDKTDADGSKTESRTTLNSDSIVHEGLLDSRDQSLDKAHDYHLDQDMGDSMEQVNANLHLGSEEDEKHYGDTEDTSSGAQGLGFENDTLEFSSEVNDETTQTIADQDSSLFAAPKDASDLGDDSGPVGGGTSSSIASALDAGSDQTLDSASFSGQFEGSLGAQDGATSSALPSSGEGVDLAAAGVIASDLSAVTDIDESENSVDENSVAGSATGIQANAGAAEGVSVVYSLPDDAGGLFSIDPETGIVSVAGALDAETAGSHQIVVLATGFDGATQTESFTINVRDVNEYDVGAIETVGAVADSISESATGGAQAGITVVATDKDVTDSVSYSVDDPRFEIDDEGVVSIAEDAVFDAESEGTVSFTVTATSTDGSQSSQTFTLAVEDENEFATTALQDIDTTTNTIAEDAAAGSQVGVTAFAEDKDVTDSVSYSVDDSRFTVDENGVVRVADGASFDAETEGSIEITVTATSTDGSTAEETFTIAVSDVNESAVSAVTDADSSANTIAEDAGAGTRVGVTALATDTDATDTVSYAVDDARFTVDDNGVVRVADGANFDAETEGSINVTVTATSTDGSTSEETFTVAVSDVDEYDISAVIDADTSANTITEDAVTGTQVGVTAFAEDEDVTDSISYTVNDTRFTVDDNGVVRVAEGASFDAETEGSVDIVVTATSSDGSSSQETFTISVSDVDEYDVSAVSDTDTAVNTISEDAKAGTEVGVTTHATDADITATVSYSVDDERFTVDEEGVVRVADGAGFDAETEGSIDIVVTATSSDGSTSQETFTIAVSDVNEGSVSNVTDTDASDNTISEAATSGTQVGITALAQDADATDTVSYAVDDMRFTIDENGVVRVADGASFDAETEGSINVTVTATSSDGSTSTETFTVAVADVDEYDVSSVSDTDVSENTIAEDAAAGTQVGITASANDADVSDTVSYAVNDSRFTVDENGVVRVADGASFDAETEGSIDIVVTATSSDGSTSEETFTIAVSDVNEVAVSAVSDIDATANGIAENAVEGTTVGITVQASDSDVTDTVTYTVSDNRFTVGEDGLVTVAAGATFDYESEPTIDLTVTATSSDGSSSQETFTLSVADVAEAYQLAEGQTTFTDTGVAETSITGNDSADTITAHDDGSTIYSGAGDDTVYGGTGNDTIIFGEGNDVVYGGAGDDFIDDERGAQPNTGDNYLDGGDGNDTIFGGSGNDTLIGGAGNDSLSGENDDDTLQGGSGSDKLYGGAGNDTLEGGAGNDYIDGGSGTDTAIYSGNRSDYTVTENANGTYTVVDNRIGSPDGTDTVVGVENFRFSDGDILVGDLVAKDISTVSDTDNSSNSIAENAGAGSTVGVTAFADDANTSDSVTYSVNDDRFTVDGNGVVTVASGASFDYETETEITITVTATSSDGSTSQESFTLDVMDVAENLQLADGGATFTDTGVSETSITGGFGNDTITAHNDGGNLYGGAGDDTLIGGTGNDTLSGGAGSDTLQGGDGDDTLIAGDGSAPTNGGTNTVGATYSLIHLGTMADVDTYESNGVSENASSLLGSYGDAGTPLYTQTVRATSNDTNADGVLADNDFYGTAETLTIGGTNYALDSLQTFDATVTFTDGTTGTISAVVIQLDNGDVYLAPEYMSNADSDLLSSKPIVGISLDTLTINDAGMYANRVDTEYQVPGDTLEGGAGNDTLIGGDGADMLQGGSGNDTLDGGKGADTAIYSGNWEDYNIVQNEDGSYTISDLRSGAPDGIDTVSNVENFKFADGDVQSENLIERPVGDVIDTNASANTIHELDGAGTQVGITAFADDPNGDALTYTSSDDRFEIDADGNITIADHAFFDSQIENSIDLTVTATSADGSQSSQSFAISVTGEYDGYFAGGEASGTFNGTDISYSVDGAGGDDNITTGDYNDRIDGGIYVGNDNLNGGGGDDLIFGRSGTDNIFGGAGDDTIIGGTGNDSLNGGDGSDLFMHGLGDGSDTINAGIGAGWTDVIDLGGGPGLTAAGEYGTDWTVTITNGAIETTDLEGGRLDLSQDADGYIDFADGSRVNFNDVEEIRW
jgi:Ca2+-binding RTX toxin-like protein